MTAESKTDSYRSIDYWHARYSERQTEWQISDVHPCLTKYSKELLLGPDKRVLVPLCGKTVDLLWLYKEGHRVVGVDGVEEVVAEFGKEHELDFQCVTTSYGKLYQTPDTRLQVIVCNLFDVTSSKLGHFDAVWDRAAITAINDCDREKYGEVMKDLMVEDFRYLAVTVDYAPTPEFSGPPSSIKSGEMAALLGGVECKVLESTEETVMKKLVRNVPVCERYCLFTPRTENSST